MSTFNEAEAHQCLTMMAACQRVVVLVDSTKFDSNIPDAVAKKLLDQGVNLLIANLSPSETLL